MYRGCIVSPWSSACWKATEPSIHSGQEAGSLRTREVRDVTPIWDASQGITDQSALKSWRDTSLMSLVAAAKATSEKTQLLYVYVSPSEAFCSVPVLNLLSCVTHIHSHLLNHMPIISGNILTDTYWRSMSFKFPTPLYPVNLSWWLRLTNIHTYLW